jgi:hypothetical protein
VAAGRVSQSARVSSSQILNKGLGIIRLEGALESA